MAIGGLLSLLDDVVAATKPAAAKTVGIISDDLALNAQQVSGVSPDRELPIIWRVAKGSLRNKAIIIPLALLANFFAPFLISPIMLIGGIYLCYEGAEKVLDVTFYQYLEYRSRKKEKKLSVSYYRYVDRFVSSQKREKRALKRKEKQERQAKKQLEKTNINNQVSKTEEDKKVNDAIITDFVLSLEIIILTLGSVSTDTLSVQAITLCLIAVFATMFVYGLVAIIIRIDDMGNYLTNKFKNNSFIYKFGASLASTTPYLMTGLSLLGTIAMLYVGSELVIHHIPFLTNIFDVHPTEMLDSLFIFGLICFFGLIFGVLSIITIKIIANCHELIAFILDAFVI